jgi:hypothetical protein
VLPVSLTLSVMVATVATVAWSRVPGVAVSPALATPTFRADIEAAGGVLMLTDTPEAVVRAGDAAFGTDGATFWADRSVLPSQALEGLIRRHIGAAWRPYETHERRAVLSKSDTSSTNAIQFIGAIFAMYGVVFGAGAVARDRDDGTLDAELSTGQPMWVTPLARWCAATLVLGLFFTMSVTMMHAVVGLEAPWTLAIGGVTASSTAAAIGMAVIGVGGKTQGFAGPMSAGLVIVMSLFSLGLYVPWLARSVPVASLLDPNLGVAPVIGLLLGPLYAWWFAARVARR